MCDQARSKRTCSVARKQYDADTRAFRRELRDLGMTPEEVDLLTAEAEPASPVDALESTDVEGQPVLELAAEMGGVTLIECPDGSFALRSLDQSPLMIDEPVVTSVTRHADFDAAWHYIVERRWFKLYPTDIDSSVTARVRERFASLNCEDEAVVERWTEMLDRP